MAMTMERAYRDGPSHELGRKPAHELGREPGKKFAARVLKAMLPLPAALLLACPVTEAAPLQLDQPGQLGQPGQARPPMHMEAPLVMEVGAAEVVLDNTDKHHVFQSAQGLALLVASHVAGWEVRCRATEARPVQGGKALGVPSIRPEQDMGDSRAAYRGRGLPTGQDVAVARGGITGARMVQVGSLRLNLACDEFARPGEYQGRLEFSLHPARGKPIPGPSVPYRLTVREFVDIRCEPNVMRFSNVRPGRTASETVRVMARTNREQVGFAFTLGEIRHAGGQSTLPANAVRLSGRDAANGRHADAGRASKGSRLIWSCGSGASVLELQGEALVDYSAPAGEYIGRIHMDVVGRK